VLLIFLGKEAVGSRTNVPPPSQPLATVMKANGGWKGGFTHSLVSGQFYEWNTDPTAVPGLLRELAKRTGIDARLAVGTLALDSPRIRANPMIIMTGNRAFQLSDAEVRNLRLYLQGGGFIFADDCGGSDYSFRRMLRDIVPETELKELPPDHPVFSSFYKLDAVPKIVDLYRGPAKAYGLTLEGRLAVVYTYDTDVACAWEMYPDGTYVHVIPPEKREAGFRLGVNVILHALAAGAAPVAGAPATAVVSAELPAAEELPSGIVRVYRMKRQLPCDTIAAIAGDENAVWFGGRTFLPGEDEGIARYDREQREFSLYMDAEGVLAEEINALALHDNKVLIGVDSWKFARGVAVFDPATRILKNYTVEDGLPHDRVIDIQIRDKEVWLASRQGLVMWDTENDTFLPFDVPGGAQSDLMISILATDDAVWVNNFEGIWLHVPESDAWTNVGTLTPLVRGSAASLARGENRVYIAPLVPSPSPVVVYDEKKEVFRPFGPATEAGIRVATALAVWHPFRARPVTGESVREEVWVGTQGELLGFAEDADGHMRLVERHSVRQGTVRRIYAEGPEVFAAVDKFEGVWQYIRARRKWRQIKTRANVPSDYVLSLGALNETLLVGTLSDGPWRFRPSEEKFAFNEYRGGWGSLNYEFLKGGRMTVYLGDRTSIRFTSINDVAVEGNRAWLASNHGLLLHDETRTPRGFEVISPLQGPVSRLATGNGAVYCGLGNGNIRSFDPVSRRWQDVWQSEEVIRALAVRGSTLWVGTDRGLHALVKGPAGCVETRKADVPVSAFLLDEDTLWIATEKGVCRHRDDIAGALEQPVAAIPNASVLLRHEECLLVAGDTELWRLRISEAGKIEETTRYDLSAHTGDYPITDMAIVGDRLYVTTSGGGLASVSLNAIVF